MFNKKTVRDLDFTDKTVLLRADYNVPLSDGKVADDYRLLKSVPTVQYLLNQNAKIIIISHLGRPGGEIKKEFTLEPVAKRLSELLTREVAFSSTTVGDGARQAVKKIKPGEIVMLENLRFHKEEKDNDVEFARQLAELADYLVQDAFGNAHRADASMDAITQFLPSVAGLLLEKEVSTITAAIEAPDKPLISIIGGSKITDKIAILDRLLMVSDTLIVGGGMANTFLHAMGYEVGKSLYEPQEADTARELMEHADFRKVKLVLPVYDVAIGESFDEESDRHDVAVDDVGKEDMILDFGKQTVEEVNKLLAEAKTIIWSGPVGVIELEKFKYGSEKIAKFIAGRKDVTSIVGGGDTAGFIHREGLIDGFSHVSTGGGASLELMAGNELPGVEALLDKH